MKPARLVQLSLGSNVEPKKNIPACIELLKKNFRVTRISSIYETKPIGPAGKQNFWNLVMEIKTSLENPELISKLRQIEETLGRERVPGNKFIPRTIDIDLLPQPGFQTMGFIIIPLAEILPGTRDPESGKTYQELANAISPAENPIFKLHFQTF